MVLDAGAGWCPYKHLFSHLKYESADFCEIDKEYGAIDYKCDLTAIPVDDNRYDAVICNQVLEHVPEPADVLKELHRILKPNGLLVLSLPFFYQEHEIPYDFYRYTQFACRYLLEKTGFKIQRIEWLEGYYGTLSYQLRIASSCLPLNPKLYGGGLKALISSLIVSMLKPSFAILSVLFSYIDVRYKNVSVGHCKNYAVTARKLNI